MKKEQEIKEAKRKLYLLLLECPVNLLSLNEIDISYDLAIDKDIQDILPKKRC